MNEMSTVAKRLLAVLFVLFVVAFVAGSLLIYNKTFVRTSRVDLYTDDVGYSLPADADVKVRGVQVGRVSEVVTAGEHVKVTLSLYPEQAENLPANVTARLLPKTLFGERYVDLALPEQPRGRLSEVDAIAPDPRGNATELGRVLDGVLPVLQAVPPEKLSQTLGALSMALEGNGDRVGASLADLGEVFDGVLEVQPELESGLRDLATFSQTYSEAAPQLIDALDALRTTGNTVVRRRDDIASGLRTVIDAAPTVRGFLEANRDDVIAVAADSRTALDNLARYSPALPCAVRQFRTSLDRSGAILGKGTPNPGIRVTVEITNPRGRYIPNQDEPRNFETRGPRCYEPGSGDAPLGQYPGGGFADGAIQVPSRNPGPAVVPDLPNPLAADPPIPALRSGAAVPPAPGRAVPPRENDPIPQSARSGGDGRSLAYAGSPMETATVRAVYGAAAGIDPDRVPSWVAGLGAPALRGAEVTVR